MLLVPRPHLERTTAQRHLKSPLSLGPFSMPPQLLSQAKEMSRKLTQEGPSGGCHPPETPDSQPEGAGVSCLHSGSPKGRGRLVLSVAGHRDMQEALVRSEWHHTPGARQTLAPPLPAWGDPWLHESFRVWVGVENPGSPCSCSQPGRLGNLSGQKPHPLQPLRSPWG